MPQPRKNPPPPSAALDVPALIGPRIKRLRIKRGLSQAQLADIVGLSREAIAAYETGRVRLLDDMIARLSLALSVSSDELLGLKKNDSPNQADEPNVRLVRRMQKIQQLPEQKRKAILKTLDDLIRANS